MHAPEIIDDPEKILSEVDQALPDDPSLYRWGDKGIYLERVKKMLKAWQNQTGGAPDKKLDCYWAMGQIFGVKDLLQAAIRLKQKATPLQGSILAGDLLVLSIPPQNTIKGNIKGIIHTGVILVPGLPVVFSKRGSGGFAIGSQEEEIDYFSTIGPSSGESYSAVEASIYNGSLLVDI